jgi:hypothetical protein
MDVIWWVGAVAGAIGINLIASELFAWGPRLSEWLMHRAVSGWCRSYGTGCRRNGPGICR